MGQGRATETERMLELGVGYTELGCSKWKNRNGFLKPNYRARAAPAKLLIQMLNYEFAMDRWQQSASSGDCYGVIVPSPGKS